MNTRTEKIKALALSYAEFIAAAYGFPQEKRRDKPSTKGFSATEIVYHMVDV